MLAIKDSGVGSPDHQKGSYFKVLDEGIMVALLPLNMICDHMKWLDFVNFTISLNENHVKSRDFHVRSTSRHFVISRDEIFV